MPLIEQLDEYGRPLRLDPGWHKNSDSRPLTNEQRRLCEAYAEEYPHLFAVSHELYHGMCHFLMNKGYSSDDIHQIAWMGVIRAAKRFEPGRSVKFSTYAAYHIQAALSRQIADMSRKMRTLAEGVEMHTPDELNVYDKEGWEGIADRRQEELRERQECNDDARHIIAKSLAMLHDRHRQVLELRFGLAGEPPMTLTKVAERIGISQSRIAQIEKAAMLRIRARSGNQLLAGAA